MNFSPKVKAWLQLVSLVLGSGSGVGLAAYSGGAHWAFALLCGLGTAATNVYHALSKTPEEKTRKMIETGRT